jgi:hypothetical protein
LPHPWRKPHPSHGDGRGDLQLWHHRAQRCARIDGYREFLAVDPGWSCPDVKFGVAIYVAISNSYVPFFGSLRGVFIALYILPSYVWV